MERKTLVDILDIVIGGSTILATLATGLNSISVLQILRTRSNYIPKIEQVQPGYVIPSKLEIKPRDLNGDGKKEVIMTYGGKPYLLTLDERGRPRIQSYEIEAAEVVPKPE